MLQSQVKSMPHLHSAENNICSVGSVMPQPMEVVYRTLNTDQCSQNNYFSLLQLQKEPDQRKMPSSGSNNFDGNKEGSTVTLC